MTGLQRDAPRALAHLASRTGGMKRLLVTRGPTWAMLAIREHYEGLVASVAESMEPDWERRLARSQAELDRLDVGEPGGSAPLRAPTAIFTAQAVEDLDRVGSEDRAAVLAASREVESWEEGVPLEFPFDRLRMQKIGRVRVFYELRDRRPRIAYLRDHCTGAASGQERATSGGLEQAGGSAQSPADWERIWIADLQQNPWSIVGAVAESDRPILVESRAHRSVVLMSYKVYRGYELTLDEVAEPDWRDRLKRATAEVGGRIRATKQRRIVFPARRARDEIDAPAYVWTPQAAEDLERVGLHPSLRCIHAGFAMSFLLGLRATVPLAGPFRELGLYASMSPVGERSIVAWLEGEAWIAWLRPHGRRRDRS